MFDPESGRLAEITFNAQPIACIQECKGTRKNCCTPRDDDAASKRLLELFAVAARADLKNLCPGAQITAAVAVAYKKAVPHVSAELTARLTH